MSFGAEIKDFLDAYKTVSGVLNDQDELGMRRQDQASLADWRRSQIKRNEWEMGAPGRERDAIIDFSEDFDIGGVGGALNGKARRVMLVSLVRITYDAPALEQAFADTESSGGNWSAVGPNVKGHRAYGKYQVMDFNIPTWTAKYYGQELSPQEFVANKDAQQAVFHGEMQRMVGQYGNLKDAMSEWFTGDDYATAKARNAHDQNMGVDEYVDRIASAYSKYTGGGQLAEATGMPTPPLAQGDAEEAIPTGDTPPPSERVQNIIDSGEWFDQQPTQLAGPVADEDTSAIALPDYWDDNQKAAVNGMHPDLLELTTRASQLAGFPIGVNIAVVDDPKHGKVQMQGGVRDEANQQHMVDIGYSKTMNSNHLKGKAIDLVPLVDGQPQWNASPEQFKAISVAMEQASKELGIPVEWGGNWKGFKDLPHYQLPKGYKGKQPVTKLSAGIDDDINDEAGIGDAAEIPSTTPDDLSPVPSAELAAMGLRPDSVGPTDVEVPDTEPVSAPPEAIPETAEEAPAAAPAARAMGYDPLPQTTGYTDVVSREGSADAVNQAMDTPVDKKKLFAGIGDFIRHVFGERQPGAIDTDEDTGVDPVADDIGGAPADLVSDLEASIRKRHPEYSQEQVQLTALSTVWNWWQLKGDPQKARGAAFAIFKTYNEIAKRTLALAHMDVMDGNFDDAIEKFVEAYSIIPDGEYIDATRNPDGSYNIITKDENGKTIKDDYNLDPRQIVSKIMKITPEQFDSMVESQFVKEEPGVPPPVPMQPEEGAIPETPDMVEPGTPDEGISTTPPMGDVTIPPDQAQGPGIYEGDEGIQVASADANAPVTSGPNVNAPPVPRYPTSIETNPGKPLNAEDYEQWKIDHQDEYDHSSIPYMDSQWEKATNRYNEWLKNQPTEEGDIAIAAYNQWFKELEEFTQTNPGKVFTPNYELLAPIKAPATLNAMREAVVSHNNTLNQQATQAREWEQLENTEEDRAREAQERATAAESQELRERLEAEARGQPLPFPGGNVRPGPMPAPPPFTPSGATLPGPMPADMDLVGTGRVAAMGEPLAPQAIPEYPAGAANLTDPDQVILRGTVDAEANRIRQENEKKFGTPREALTPEYIENTTTKITAEQAKFFEAGKRNLADNPDGLESLVNLEESINKNYLGERINAAAIEVARTGGDNNAGMTPELATQTVLSMIMVPTEAPDYPHYSAEYSQTQPGMVDVTFDDGGAVTTMPIAIYQDLDQMRRTMAADYINAMREGRESAANRSIIEQEAYKAGAPVREQMEEEMVAPPVDIRVGPGAIQESTAPSTMTPMQQMQWELEHQ